MFGTLEYNCLVSNDLFFVQVAVSDAEGNLDMYPQKVGIRTVGWNSTTLTMNNKPLYLRGCGKHEDADVSMVKVFLDQGYQSAL